MTLDEALRVLEPHLDAVICYASDMGEHPPNEAVVVVRKYLAETPAPHGSAAVMTAALAYDHNTRGTPPPRDSKGEPVMSTVEEHFAILRAMKPREGGWLTDRFHRSAAIFLGAHLDELEEAWKAFTLQPEAAALTETPAPADGPRSGSATPDGQSSPGIDQILFSPLKK